MKQTYPVIQKITLQFLYICFFILFLASFSYADDDISYAISDNDLSFLREDFSPHFELLDRNSGLSNLSVSSIAQDRYGFLWFATQGGLNLYDGRRISTYRHNPFDDEGLVHNLIQTMYYDEALHQLWIGTYQGISMLSIHDNHFTNFTVDSHGLSNSIVIAITKSSDGTIWAGTMNGLNKIDQESGKISVYEVPGNVIRDLFIDSKNRLLVGTHKGLYYFDDKKEELIPLEVDLPSPYVMVVEEFTEGILTLGLWDGGVVRIDMDDYSLTHHEYDHNDVYTLYKTHDHILWVGTWGGGLFAEAPDGEVYHFSGEGENKELEHPVIYSLLQDHSGILWIGTNGGGINKLNPRQNNYVAFSHDPENPSSLSAGKINSIIRDAQGQLWIAVYNNGLNRYDPIKKKMHHYFHDPEDPTSLPSDNIVTMHLDHAGNLLLGSNAGLIQYDDTSDDFQSLPYFDDDLLVYSIEEQDHYLWIGTYNDGVYRYNRNTEETSHYYYGPSFDAIISDNLVYDILVDSQDRVWIGTNNGLNVLSPESDKFKTYKRGSASSYQLASNTIRVVYEDSKGNIWIGLVGGGLALYQEETDDFKTFLEQDGLSSNTITGILEDQEGRIWAATHDGISIVDPVRKDIITLSPQDGIGGWEFNSGHFRDTDGSLFFGGVHGISIIPGNFSGTGSTAPIVYISSIELFQNQIASEKMFFNAQHLDFNAQENFLGFQFAAIDYDAPDKTRFSYYLEGFDADWIHAGSRDYATYSNLPPGQYKLHVLAENVHGIVSEPAVFSFSIATPWHLSTFAFLLYITFFILLLMGAFKLRETRLVRQRNSILAALNLQLEEANQKLETMSTTDSLTGLFNRRYFDTVLEDQFQLSKRSKRPISLLMFDIDHFKNINDTFGHIVGDEVLKQIGKAAKEVLPRNTDFIARYGGDEFAVVLYDTQEKGAITVAQRIMDNATHIQLDALVNASLMITVSIGICSIVPDEKTHLTELIQSADQALYQSKTKGRNRMTIFGKDSKK